MAARLFLPPQQRSHRWRLDKDQGGQRSLTKHSIHVQRQRPQPLKTTEHSRRPMEDAAGPWSGEVVLDGSRRDRTERTSVITSIQLSPPGSSTIDPLHPPLSQCFYSKLNADSASIHPSTMTPPSIGLGQQEGNRDMPM